MRNAGPRRLLEPLQLHTRGLAMLGNGAEFFTAVDALGLEGIVSKRIRSAYHAGIRSSDWLKVKCFHTQRFCVIGYTTESANGKEVLSSLALAGDGGH